MLIKILLRHIAVLSGNIRMEGSRPETMPSSDVQTAEDGIDTVRRLRLQHPCWQKWRRKIFTRTVEMENR